MLSDHETTMMLVWVAFVTILCVIALIKTNIR